MENKERNSIFREGKTVASVVLGVAKVNASSYGSTTFTYLHKSLEGPKGGSWEKVPKEGP